MSFGVDTELMQHLQFFLTSTYVFYFAMGKKLQYTSVC